MNLDISRWIPAYPSQDDPDFMKKMVVKEEIREMLLDPIRDNRETPFFYNGQIMIGRWLAPWTNNRSLLIYASPGVGKTRMALAYMTMWMEHSNHRRALVLSANKTILKAFSDEVLELKDHTKVVEERKWVVGKKSSGKAIHTTRFIRTKGFENDTISLVAHIAKEKAVSEFLERIYDNYDRLIHMTMEEAEEEETIYDIYMAYTTLRNEIRERYKEYVITIDEVHIFRQSMAEDKISYSALILLLDSLRDLCPILLMTATPVVDTWKDLMSILGMLQPYDKRMELEDDVSDVEDGTMSIPDVVSKWGQNLVSYRTSEGIVPAKLPLPGLRSSYTIITSEEEEIPLSENIYPVFMSYYQTTVTTSFEIKGIIPTSLYTKNIDAVSSEAGIYSWRKYYDFVPPSIEREDGTLGFMSMDELITEDAGKYVPTMTSYLNAGQDPVFEVIWNEDGTFSKDRGLGKYAIKIAELIRLLKYNTTLQNTAGYIHTIWVEYGTKPIAAALNANGWEQYTGAGEVPITTKPKFAVIHGAGLSDTKIHNIIANFNSPNNHDGSVLRLIVGSRKSGISISFTNAQFFLEMSSTFNKSVHIQSEGRVYRKSSLEWKPRNERVIYSADIVALPSLEEDSDDPAIVQYRDDINNGIIRDTSYYAIEDGDNVLSVSPYTIEMRLNYLAQDKFDISQTALTTLRSVSIEEVYKKYLHLPSDRTSYDILYSGAEVYDMKKKIKDIISKEWISKVDINDMIQARAVASLTSSRDLVLSNYGIPAPVQDMGEYISSYRGRRSENPMSLTYNQNFFITEDIRSYNIRTISSAISIIRDSSTDEYDFFYTISSLTSGSIKMFLLEMVLAMNKSLISGTDIDVLNSRRDMILSLYSHAWNTFDPSTITHILWYMVRNGSYVSKLGITSDPEGRSRILVYNTERHTSSSIWKYETNRDKESVYLSVLARKIFDKEMEVINRAKPSDLYVHFSLSDGLIRIRQINLKDLRKSRFFLPGSPDVASFIHSLTGSTSSTNKDIYYAAKEKGILIIR